MNSLHDKLLKIYGDLASNSIVGRLVVERPDERTWEQIVKAICIHNLESPRAHWKVPDIGPVRRVLNLEDNESLGDSCIHALHLDDDYALVIEPMNGGFSVRVQKNAGRRSADQHAPPHLHHS